MQDGVCVRCGLGQRADRLRRGQDDEFDLAAAGLVPDLLHHRQRAVGAAADHQPAAGTGAGGALPVMQQVRDEARRRKVDLVVLPTAEAIGTLAKGRAATNAILHLTC